MALLSLKSYAVKNRLPIYTVVKMVKEGKLKTEKKIQDGKEELFIVLDDKSEDLVQEKERSPESQVIHDYESAYKKLEKEYRQLLRKYMELKRQVIEGEV